MKHPYKYYKELFSSIFSPAIKMFSNGIPLKCDTFNSCASNCRYCYVKALRTTTLGKKGVTPNFSVARILNLKRLATFFENAYNGKNYDSPFLSWAIRQHYFTELGTMGETFQEADLDFRVTYNYFKLMSEYKMPIFINTKLNLVCHNDEYKKLLTEHKAPIIICLTLTTEDDKLGKLYEPLSPLPSERLKTIKELNQYDHIKTIVYISPFMPGVTNLNIKAYVDALLDAGIVSAHLRDFFMQGKTFQNTFWQNYIKENRKDVEAFFGGYHATYESKKKFLIEAQEYAQKRDPDFQIVGMKNKWFELTPCHGKMCYDILPQKFKDGITDWTAIPIMRKIRENIDTPQLLDWTKIGFKKDLINLPERIRTNEGNINNIMEGLCNCNTSDFDYEMTGWDWLVDGLWNGYIGDKPTGYFANLDYIFPVKSQGNYCKDNQGNYLYAYLPKQNWDYLQDEGQLFLNTPTSTKELDNPSVDWNIAKDFMVPERIGGVSDKFYQQRFLSTLT